MKIKFLSFILSISFLLTSCNTSINNNLDEEIKSMSLPVGNKNNFQWGVAMAGYQSEGYDNTSIWYYWDISGKTKHRNLRAVDFYNRYKEDLDLAKSIGINAFRFSIEWSRIEPRKGFFDTSAIEYYRNLIMEIKKRGMEPLVTLVHFNYPQWLLEEDNRLKGIENPVFINYFLRYVDKVVQEYGSEVKYWITFNEPNIWVPGAYLLGQTPPGKKNPISMIRAGWNLIKAHCKAYDLIHRLDNDAMVSSNVYYIISNPFAPSFPVPSESNYSKLFPSVLQESNMNNTDWFMESINSGKVYVNRNIFLSDDNINIQSKNDLISLEEELKNENVNQQGDSQVSWLKRFDYVSFDYYYRFRSIKDVLNLFNFWDLEIYPPGLYDAIMYYHRKYNKPIIIAENGFGLKDLQPRKDGWTREAHLVEHVKQVKKAISSGANVLGYYYWSLTDNYEWGSFEPRFGLYSVNALTDPELKRIPTKAVDAYRDIINNNGVTEQIQIKYGYKGK
ncbi:MAG: beta-glucosidase [Candidatus Sericytochromatia bacterium]|nr:MAG: beta-glucosidase [Candidatus Sericytochromatia bacterium]